MDFLNGKSSGSGTSSSASSSSSGSSASFGGLLSGVSQGITSYSEGVSTEKQANANAEVELENARIALFESRRRTLIARKEGRSVESQITTAAAAGGLAQTGTVLQAKLAARRNAELNAIEEQRIGLTQYRKAEHSAQMDRFRGKIARQAGKARAFASVGSALT